jgi:hypothetical protein
MIATNLRKFMLTAVLVILASSVSLAQGSGTSQDPLTQGTFNYSYTTQVISCGVDSFNEYQYTNFSYTDVNGQTQRLPGSALYDDDSSGSCFSEGYPNGPNPSSLQLSGTDSLGDVYTFTVFPDNSAFMAAGDFSDVPGIQGTLNPKYKIVGVIYAPPGSSSSVSYTNTTMMGTSTSTQSSFAKNESSSVTICGGGKIPATPTKTKTCGTYSNSFTQESDSSSSFSVNQTQTFANQWPGSSDGLDHGNDRIVVWLNPVLWFSGPAYNPPQPANVIWNGYSFDPADDAQNGGDMDVVYIPVSECLNPSTIPQVDPTLYNSLQRAWAQANTDGSSPAINDTDLAAICAADPFSNPNYVISIPQGGVTTTDGRFIKTSNQQLLYQPGTALAGAGQFTYNWKYDTTHSRGTGAKYTYQHGFAIDVDNTAGWIAWLEIELKASTTFTWTDQSSNVTTQEASEQNVVSITGPKYCAPGTVGCTPYEGPEQFVIYQDNIYGTFMMNPVPQFFTAAASPGSLTINPGASAVYTISTTPNAGYSGTLNFTLQPGLPSGASGTFSATQASAGGAVTFTINTIASTPPGSYPLAVEAKDNATGLIYFTYFNLVVSIPDFSISSSPGSQTVTAGSGTTFAASTQSLNGFSGNVILSTTGLPSGISVTFSPNPVAVGSSSTMTVNASSSTAIGAYGLTINGTSGSLMHTVSPNPVLIVNGAATLTTLAVTPANSSVAKSATKQYTATGTYSDNSTKNLTSSVTWTSSNTGVATIASGGLATGVAAGSSTIKATLGTVSGSTALTVTASTTPSITSLSPTSGPEGTLVTVTGTNFGGTQGTSVIKFNGLVAAVTTWSNTQITVAVPRGATTGNVAVTVGGVASNGKAFTVTGALTITTISPTSGPEGTLVTVTGTNFGATQGTSTLKFNGLVSATTTWSNTKITVAVPRVATTGNVAVLVNKVATNGITFTVTGALTITSISPTSGAVGTLVTVTGTNFGATQGTSTLKFNGLVSATTTWSNTKITVKVPSGATTGNIAVLVNKIASNGILFTVH